MRLATNLVRLVGASFCIIGLTSVAQAAANDDKVFYEVFKEGDAVTDQATTRGSRSSLIGTYEADNADIMDDDFATNVATPALKAGAKVFWIFGQCYSGGFIDDLAPLGGVQSIITSARHSETASYGYEPPTGVDVDFTDALIQGIADGKTTAEGVARHTAEVDPFGPNPDTPRISEPADSEHTQYFSTEGGSDLKIAEHAETGIAVLWAGQPAERDGTQMNLMIDKLVAMGYARDRIWLMYGGGEASALHPVVRNHILGKAKQVNLLAATRENLVDLFAQQFDASRKTKPDFVFFYVGDHGGLNGEAVAKNHFEAADMLVTPNFKPSFGAHLYGDGHQAFKKK